MNHVHSYPCLHCHPKSYIGMVHHLIERCLLLRMTKDDCIEAIAKHANIRPKITLIVWEELMKENKDFFHNYFHATCPSSSPSPRPRPRPCTYPRVNT